MTEYTGLSESDNSNTTVSSVNIAEGCPPSGINDALRAILGLLARALNMLTGKYASTGSANAYVLTPSSALPAYTTGGRYSFRANFANTGAATLNISSLGAKTIKKMAASGKADLASGDIQSGQPVTVEYDGTDFVMVTPVAEFNINALTADSTPDPVADYVVTYDASASGNKKALLGKIGIVAQVVNTQTGAVATSTATIPGDDTIPQNTEGFELMTLAITPKSASSTLIIEAVVHLASSSTTPFLVAALFQDNTANALAAAVTTQVSAGSTTPIVIRHKMTAGTTSATTFKVRGGAAAASTTTFNGTAGNRLFGGVFASSITITEILP